jgi:hypothetical protein
MEGCAKTVYHVAFYSRLQSWRRYKGRRVSAALSIGISLLRESSIAWKAVYEGEVTSSDE